MPRVSECRMSNDECRMKTEGEAHSSFAIRHSSFPRRRLLLYGSLACGLGLALYPPKSLSRSRQTAAATAQNDEMRGVSQAILKKYLSSLPDGDPSAALADLETLDGQKLVRLLDWLPTPPDQRPLTLADTGLDTGDALFAALLETSLTGYQPASLDELPALFHPLPLAKGDPLRLRLLAACAERARREKQPALRLDFLAAAARHPAAGWPQVRALIETATAERSVKAAIDLLQDWLDDPPSDTEGRARLDEAHLALARLLLLDNRPQDAWESLRPLLEKTGEPPAADVLDLAWTLAGPTGHSAALIAPLEAHLLRFPQHRLNWRELTDAPPAAPDYLAGLRRLGTACLEAGEEARAVEIHLHLAWLDDAARLVPALSVAAHLGRLPEALDLLDRLEQEAPQTGATGPRHLVLAAGCLERGDPASARHLLDHHLRQHPRDPAAARLLIQTQAGNLPSFQAAQLWKRHLQSHPSDSAAHHLLCETWLQSGQPRAAVNHLLQAGAENLDPALRLRAARLAVETRQHTAFVTSVERLLAARDPIPSDALPALLAHTEALGQPRLAAALRGAGK